MTNENVSTSLRAAAPVVQQGVSDEEWKQAVLDEVSIHGMAFPIGTAPRTILKAVIQCAEDMALDPQISARAASLAGAAAGGVPAGFKLVPLVPTPEMLSAVDDSYGDGGDFDDMWQAALAAAPSRDCAVAEVTDEMIDAACRAVPDLYRVDAMLALEAALSGSPAAPAPQTDPSSGQCPYAALEGQVCNKCGRIHSAQAAVEGQQAVAWMDPDTRDVINAERKHDWNNHFGMGGVAKAKGYTMPLYASPAVAPSAQPVRVLTDAMVDAAQVLAPCCTRREDVRAMLQAAIGAAPSAQEGGKA